MMKNKIYKLVLVAAIALCSLTCINAEPQNGSTVKIHKKDMQRLVNTLGYIQQNYIESVDGSTLFDYAIKGMLTNLDPHSSYLDKSDLANLNMVTSGKFGGIGITVSPAQGAFKVISPIDNSPAQKAGIQAGDLIVRINDTLLKDIPLDKAIKLMRGKNGTTVTLYILRNNKILKFKLKRATIKIPTIKTKLLENHYGYLRIAIFHDPTAKGVKAAIAKLKSKAKGPLQGLIIDVRNNPGGLLMPAIKTADMFLDARNLEANKLIMYMQGKSKKKEIFNATNGELLPNVPIVVLINAGSASAAEILAGALQDHHRALVLGTKSFGKGSVQKVFMLDKNRAIKLTVALYYTPSGTSIQAKGIIPDVLIPALKIPEGKDTTPYLTPLYEINLRNHFKNGKTTPKQKQLERSLMHQDFQLYEALNVLKGLSASQD